MQQIAASVARWVAEGRKAFVARAIALDGFGGRRDGEAVAWSEGERIGSLLGGSGAGALDAAAAELGTRTAVSVEIALGDEEAVGAGLACGGRATVLVQDAAAIPPVVWERLAARDAVALATALDGVGEMAIAAPGASPDHVFGTLGALDRSVLAAAARVLAGGGATRRTVEENGRAVLVELLAPVSEMVVVGAGNLASALVQQGRLLGWEVRVLDERTIATEAIVRDVMPLGPVDGLVVLSHALGPSCAALAAALQGRCGYVGALGSRHTQSARADRLRAAHALDDSAIDRVHGPVGLDIGARTPEETSLAVFAEVLAHRSGRAAAPLRSGDGPING